MRRLVPLTGDAVASLPGPCAGCLVWELGLPNRTPRSVPAAIGGPPRWGEPSGDESHHDASVRKQAWVSAHVQDGHPPGRVLQVDGEVAGYVLFGPATAFAPRGPLIPLTSPDALLLATMWVQPHWRERGLGRLLVQAAIKEAVRIDAPAVEVYGDRRWRERSCMLPVTWLLHEGFEVHREHLRTPLLRLDVKRTVRWAESLEHALEEILEAIPRRKPASMPEGANPAGTPRMLWAAPGRRSADPGAAPPRGPDADG